MTERWLPVVGFEGLYEVSDFGRVRSLTRKVHNYTKRGRFLVAVPRRNYLGKITHYAVALGRGKPRRVHRLVLEAFVGPCPEGLQGCHEDGKPENNFITNLRWDTPKANQEDSVRHGTKQKPPVHRRGSNARTWLNEDEIRCIQAEPYFLGVNQMLGRCFGTSYKTAERVRKTA